MKIKDKTLLRVCKQEFLKWLEDDSYIEDYSHFSFPEGKILIRVFLYSPPRTEGNIIGLDNKSLSTKLREVLLPYGKVIKAGPSTGFFSTLEPGDIVALPDELVEIEKNPQYEFYREAMKERPRPEVEMPPMYIGKISRWYPYQFILDKMDHVLDEEVMDMTFLIPQTQIVSKVDKKFFEKYKVYDLIEMEGSDLPKEVEIVRSRKSSK